MKNQSPLCVYKTVWSLFFAFCACLTKILLVGIASGSFELLIPAKWWYFPRIPLMKTVPIFISKKKQCWTTCWNANRYNWRQKMQNIQQCSGAEGRPVSGVLQVCPSFHLRNVNKYARLTLQGFYNSKAVCWSGRCFFRISSRLKVPLGRLK